MPAQRPSWLSGLSWLSWLSCLNRLNWPTGSAGWLRLTSSQPARLALSRRLWLSMLSRLTSSASSLIAPPAHRLSYGSVDSSAQLAHQLSRLMCRCFFFFFFLISVGPARPGPWLTSYLARPGLARVDRNVL